MEGLLLAEKFTFCLLVGTLFIGQVRSCQGSLLELFFSAIFYFSLGASAHSVADGTLLKLFGRVAIHAW